MSSFFLDQSTAKRYNVGRPFTYGDINYTAQGATAETFKGLGFKEVQIQPRPDDRYYIISGPNDDGSYNADPRDLGQLKDSFLQESRTQEGQILSGSDWMFARQAETGEAVPQAWLTYRGEVRSTGDANRIRISATKTVDELQKLMSGELEPWPQDPTQTPVPMKAETAGKRTRR